MNFLFHYGVGHEDGGNSGRYPWGSGDIPYQHSDEFYNKVNRLRNQDFVYTDKSGKKYYGDTAIAKSMGMSTTEFRVKYSMAKDERRAAQVEMAKSMKEKGFSPSEIGRKMDLNESTVRSLLNEHSEARMRQAQSTATFIKKRIDATNDFIDVAAGVEAELGISRVKLNEALYILQEQGYKVYNRRIPQVTNPGKRTTINVICPPGTEYKDIYDFDRIHSLVDYKSFDDGETFKPRFVYPSSMDSKRLAIRYSEDGGSEKDGIIEIRRGVKDLSLGDARYSQVRILVDGTHYLKGMAVYSDDLPDGIDVMFNTNKTKDTPMMKVLKPIKTEDPSNPFGSLIKELGGQSYYIDDDGTERLSLINKRSEEGDWGEWQDKLSAQFLSKQSVSLIRRQLQITTDDRQQEFDEIMSLTNPTIKRKLLESFASDCDSSAVHLKAAALPRQKYQVILPLTSIKETEVYAPNYINGEKVALVRYPHGGTFEIPILTVNNKNPEGSRVITKNAIDAVGINKKVADRLSGADFDGDTVMVIPISDKVRITSTPPLKDLEGFDPKMEYPERPGMRYMKGNTQKEMGVISNLITDMTLEGATEEELARAVKHSMVVIDAEKHKLDYKRSYVENGIAELHKKYQGRYDSDGKYREGAATLISKSKSDESVIKRQGSPRIAEDGSLVYKVADDAEYVDPRTGQVKLRKQRSTKMAETSDAFTLVSRYNTPEERAYAEYANKMKSLANQARKELLKKEKIVKRSEAAEQYSVEVSSLKAKLNVAEKNAPRERQAQNMANAMIKEIKDANPDLTRKEEKKISQQKLTYARGVFGAKRTPIEITDREWEAIQAGAISDNVLWSILKYTDLDKLRERATPRSTVSLSETKIQRIKMLESNGYTNSEIAQRLGISTATVDKYINKRSD